MPDSESDDAGVGRLSRGQLIDDRFELGEAIGRGGMSRVYRAQDRQGGASVAVKVLRPELAASPAALGRLRREAEILARLAHPSIVRLLQSGTLPGGSAYLAMELLDGHTLGQWMRRKKRLGLEELAPVVASVCAAVSAAHGAGVVHRDLKPDNIFVCSLDHRVKLLDFGVSKLYGDGVLTRPGELLGTPRYMAPEQLRPGTEVGPAVDIYAMGVILYESLSGRPPFSGTSPADILKLVLRGEPTPLGELRPDLPGRLHAVIARAMSLEPHARYESMESLGDAFLTEVQRSGVGVPTAPLGEWPHGLGAGGAEGSGADGADASDSGAPRFSSGHGSALPAEPPSWMSDGPMRLSPVPPPPSESEPPPARITGTASERPPVVAPSSDGWPAWVFFVPGLVVLAIAAWWLL